jgi:hypothetical protein
LEKKNSPIYAFENVKLQFARDNLDIDARKKHPPFMPAEEFKKIDCSIFKMEFESTKKIPPLYNAEQETNFELITLILENSPTYTTPPFELEADTRSKDTFFNNKLHSLEAYTTPPIFEFTL